MTSTRDPRLTRVSPRRTFLSIMNGIGAAGAFGLCEAPLGSRTPRTPRSFYLLTIQMPASASWDSSSSSSATPRWPAFPSKKCRPSSSTYVHPLASRRRFPVSWADIFLQCRTLASRSRKRLGAITPRRGARTPASGTPGSRSSTRTPRRRSRVPAAQPRHGNVLCQINANKGVEGFRSL